MDDSINTQEAEVKAPEGSIDAEVAKTQPEAVEKPEVSVEHVPLSVYLDLKKDFKELKKEVQEAKDSDKSKIRAAGYSDLTQKYPDVSPEFIQDMLGAATLEAQKKIEEKYTPIIAKQEQKEKQLAFDKAFDNLFDKTLQDNPDLPKTIDKELVKELALTPKYRNVPLSDILIKIYGNQDTGKSSSENDMRTGSDIVDDIVSFDRITEDQRKAIMADPKARGKYFDWLDKQPGR